MAYFRFKKESATIVNYFPQLLRQTWWFGYQNPETGGVSLMPEGKDPLPSAFMGLVVSADDVAEKVDKKPE